MNVLFFMSLLKVVFTFNYEEVHPLYIDAMAISQFTKPCSKIKAYEKDCVKAELLFTIDKLFNIEVTNSGWVGIECLGKREMSKTDFLEPMFPEVHVIVIWKHKVSSDKYDEITRC